MIANQEFISIRQPGTKGLNTLFDPQDVDDLEVTDALNVILESYIEPRKGCTLVWEKPSSETNDPLCTFNAITSDGINYAIAVYGNNFYFRDETNNQWIKINSAYTPTLTSLMYSYINWNAGRANDSIYACNGQESVIKIPICFSTVATAVASGDSTIVLSDASYFPTSGTIAVKELNGTEVYLTYTSKSTNTLTLSGTAGTAIGVGAGVCCQIQEKASMKKGKAMVRHQRRFFIANYYGGETAIHYSVTEDPEDFTAGTGTDDGGALIISDGNGEITGLHDFGEFLLIEKEDSLHKFALIYNSSLNAKLDQIVPVVSDKSMGPINPWSSIKKNNTLYYPTPNEGFFALNPDMTGQNSSVGVKMVAKDIQSLATSFNYDNARVNTIDQKILWSCASNTVNDTILVYDTLRDYWTRFNNWNVKDWLPHNDSLYFISRIDGNIYETFTTNYIDNDTQYEAYALSKRFDFGKPCLPKTMTYIYIQGYIKSTTKLYVDVLFNEGGSLATKTYLIDGSGNLTSQPISEALAMIMLGIPLMGGTSIIDIDSQGVFRGYLAIPISLAFYNVQLKFYTNAKDSEWAVTGLGFNPQLVQKIPPQLEIGVISDPTN